MLKFTAEVSFGTFALLNIDFNYFVPMLFSILSTSSFLGYKTIAFFYLLFC